MEALKVQYWLVTMNGIAILRDVVRSNIKYNNTVIWSEMLRIGFYFSRQIINDTLGILHLIYRELQSDCPILLKHFSKARTHFVVCNVVTNYYHLSSEFERRVLLD